MKFVRACYWLLIRFLTRFRYRVRVEGLEKLRDLKGPTLVMPNHPGLIDPPLVLSNVRIPGGMRPIVTTSMYRMAALYPLMRLVNAVEVPDLAEQSRDAREQTLAMIETVAAGLNRGENFLIYPAGRTERRGKEDIGATRAVADLLARCPQANIVLVRTRGVWGSIFTFAYTGQLPDLGRCFLRGLGWVFAALFFFLPRRKVTMTVERIDRRDLPGITRDKLNPFLEAWYNQGGPEKPTFVPFSFLFGPRQHEFPAVATPGEVDVAKIRPATIGAVNEMVEERLKRPLSAQENSAEMQLERLGLDSLERMDLALHIEDRFGFRSDRVAETLGELWALAEGQLTTGENKPQPAPAAWNVPPRSKAPPAVLGETLAEAFVRRVLKQPDDVVAADQLSGVLSYRKLYVAASLMARRFRGLQGTPHAPREGNHHAERDEYAAVGVLLPGSVAADVVFFGLHLAGKLPVLLNWTTGPANLAHAVETLGIRHVVTSKKLIDRLGIEIKGAEYLFLEDIRGGIGKLEAAATLLSTYIFPRHLLRGLPQPDVNAPAVVLFTSGSESTPKAVPLSHRNLISNLRAALAVLQATSGDVLLGFLPPFHSFGLLGNVLAPILAGIRVAHYPDPTDAAGLVRTAATYHASIIVTTPTFLSFMFAAAQPDQLASLRVVVAGAEKCPDTLFERAKQMMPQAVILEGYGITECSPVVAGNRREKIKLGTVGPPVEGVEICIVDPESRRPLPAGSTGMLLVRGPSIFNGYLNFSGPDPFAEVEGKRWYVTGDLVRVDEDGYIHFCGRLKRFLKIGGEMVSLPALEEPLGRLYPATENGPQVAVEGVDLPSRWIVLFTTQDISLQQANVILAEAGLRGVMRLDAVERIEAIPVLGTGKTDYKVLRKRVAERTI
jgi:acyl-CoA synthetase (AMP-forming)/AMP-acid ligase II/1-acyl-sn-glycerol-3-phosphate acyltransferase/acyl carrier protein